MTFLIIQKGRHTPRRPGRVVEFDDIKVKLSVVWICRRGLRDADAQLGNLVCRRYQQLEYRQGVRKPDWDELQKREIWIFKADGGIFPIHTNLDTQSVVCEVKGRGCIVKCYFSCLIEELKL